MHVAVPARGTAPLVFTAPPGAAVQVTLPGNDTLSADDSAFVSKLFAWVEKHPRTKMVVYYQDFGSTSPYRIQNYPESLSVLTDQLHSGDFPAYAPAAPQLPPPPPGGVEAG